MRLKEAMGTFSPMEQQVALFIINYPGDVVNMSIEELAQSCQTSVSSVVRLCKSADYVGYKELLRVLSIDLAMDQGRDITYKDIQVGDPSDQIAKSVCMSHIQAIENTMSLLDSGDMQKVVDTLCQAKRVDFYGIGTSGLVALDAQDKFVRIGKVSMSSGDPHQQILTAALLKEKEVAVLISYSGDTRDILELADIIRQTPASLISLTRYSRNPLSQKAQLRLYCSSAEMPVRIGPMSSRIGSMTVIDALYTAVASAQYREVKKYLDKTQLVSSRKHLYLSK
jgi:DNA-binding MurR/RpiR family transcriptional regulator